ncbi:hypothetical protein IWQ57_004666 [Coemansia nantahalensis]|uniref:Uncharacterized protein n=2 Tax=Coemansia TaxID=4863 RepID=A0ACC1JR34_9FUNG|nr:hypothetical protein IWQ57_004666 [Coemansia nantahalensis]
MAGEDAEHGPHTTGPSNITSKSCSQQDADASKADGSPVQRRLALLVAVLYAFIAGFDFAAAAAALPVIGIKFSQYTTVNWVVTAYMIAMGVAMPSVRRLAAVGGQRAALLAFGLLHIAGAAMSGAAHGVPLLLAGRAVAGLGATGTVMVPMMAATEAGPRCWRVCCFRALLAAWLVGSVVGLAAGARLSSLSSWRWVFYFDLPFLAVGLVVGAVVVRAPAHDGPVVDKLMRVDWMGSVFVAGSVLAMDLAMNYGGNLFAWSSGVVIGLLVLAVALFFIFVFIESKMAREPILPRGLFQERVSAALLVMQPLIGIGIYAPVVYVTIWYSTVKGVSSTSAALRVLAIPIGALLAAAVSEAVLVLLKRCRLLLPLSAVLMAVGSGLLITLKSSTSAGLPIVYMAVLGLGAGASLQAPLIVIWRASGVSELADVVASVMFLRLLGAATGIGMLNAILQNNLSTKLAVVALENLFFAQYVLKSPDNPDIMQLPRVPQSARDDVAHANAQGLRSVFIAGFAVVAVSIPLLVFLPHRPRRSPPAAAATAAGVTAAVEPVT